MDTIDEESAFDFAAVVEESEKQMRAMYANLPAQICAAVADAIARTGRVEALKRQTEAQEQANGNAVRASELLLANIKKMWKVAVALALIMPLLVVVKFYAEHYWLNSEIAMLEERVQGLRALAANLRPGNPDGLELVNYTGGEKGIILPKGASYSFSAPIPDGREAVVFTR